MLHERIRQVIHVRFVRIGARIEWLEACHDGRARWSAKDSRGLGIGKNHSLVCQLVQVGRFYLGIAHCTHHVVPVIYYQKQYIRALSSPKGITPFQEQIKIVGGRVD